MAFLSLSLRGGRRLGQLARRYDRLPKRLRNAYLQAARVGAREASKHLKNWAPRRTGNLKRGITVRARITRRGQVSVKMFFPFYATFQPGFREAQAEARRIVRSRIDVAIRRELRGRIIQ